MPGFDGEEWVCPALPKQPTEQRLLPRLAIHVSDRFGEGNIFRTSLDAILRVAAFGDAAGAEESFNAFAGVHGAGGMHVK